MSVLINNSTAVLVQGITGKIGNFHAGEMLDYGTPVVGGVTPGNIYLPGRIGIVGRSGTLGYEAASQLKELGIGISTSVGIGGDPINGSSHRDILELFEDDPGTDAVIMIGEIGGPQEAEAAVY